MLSQGAPGDSGPRRGGEPPWALPQPSASGYARHSFRARKKSTPRAPHHGRFALSPVFPRASGDVPGPLPGPPRRLRRWGAARHQVADCRELNVAPGRTLRTRAAGVFLFLPLLTALGFDRLAARLGLEAGGERHAPALPSTHPLPRRDTGGLQGRYLTRVSGRKGPL